MNFPFFFPLQQQLPMEFSATTDGKKWKGEALVPWAYFPPNVNKMNSYAIHGSGENRTYEALNPIPKDEIVEGQKPDLWVDLAVSPTSCGESLLGRIMAYNYISKVNITQLGSFKVVNFILKVQPV